MNIREGIIQAIKANAAITALVSTRVWFGYAPTGTDATGPWIVVTRLNNKREAAHSGDQSLMHGVYQCTIGGTNKVQVDQVQDLLIRNFNGVQYTHEGKTILFLHQDDRDGWSDGTRVQEPSVDLEIWVED